MEITIKEIQQFLKENESKLSFEKLTKKGYYYFDDFDKSQTSFYVKFESEKNIGKWNFKKISIAEVVELYNQSFNKKLIKREDFNRICENTLKSGPCGFAVIIRLLEEMSKGEYLGHGKGFKIN